MIQFISKLLVSSIVIFILLLSSKSIAEDIELYLSEAVLQNEIKPQVLIIFDDSGSMSIIDENSKAAYDPRIVYGGPLASNFPLCLLSNKTYSKYWQDIVASPLIKQGSSEHKKALLHDNASRIYQL